MSNLPALAVSIIVVIILGAGLFTAVAQVTATIPCPQPPTVPGGASTTNYNAGDKVFDIPYSTFGGANPTNHIASYAVDSTHHFVYVILDNGKVAKVNPTDNTVTYSPTLSFDAVNNVNIGYLNNEVIVYQAGVFTHDFVYVLDYSDLSVKATLDIASDGNSFDTFYPAISDPVSNKFVIPATDGIGGGSVYLLNTSTNTFTHHTVPDLNSGTGNVFWAALNGANHEIYYVSAQTGAKGVKFDTQAETFGTVFNIVGLDSTPPETIGIAGTTLYVVNNNGDKVYHYDNIASNDFSSPTGTITYTGGFIDSTPILSTSGAVTSINYGATTTLEIFNGATINIGINSFTSFQWVDTGNKIAFVQDNTNTKFVGYALESTSITSGSGGSVSALAPGDQAWYDSCKTVRTNTTVVPILITLAVVIVAILAIVRLIG